MKIALLQMLVEPGAVDRNLVRAAELVGDAAAGGAQIVLLPEALPFGWMDGSSRLAAEEIPTGRHFREFARMASRHSIYLCTGLVEKQGERIFNSAVLISPSGDLLLHHRKIHELGIAHDCYDLGDRLGVVETGLGRIGLMICADGFASGQAITRALSLMGAQLILSPCAWAVPPDHNNAVEPYGKLWMHNYGPVAREYGVWIAGCSNVGPVKTGPWQGHRCIGCSLLVNPDGAAELRGSYGEAAEEILFTDIVLKAAAPIRGGLVAPVWDHYSVYAAPFSFSHT